MKTQAIIVAAGSGARFGSKVPKALVRLKKKPLIGHSLDIFERSKNIESVIIVGHKDHLGRFEVLGRKFKKMRCVVAGGNTRAESVKCGLAALDQDTDFVLVHDAARPFIDEAMIKRLVQVLHKCKAAITAVPVKATIKKVDPKALNIQETPPRGGLWEAQTPQGFHKDILIKAHGRTFKSEATDDAMLVERMGIKVRAVMGSYRNIKITTPEDLALAGALIKS